MHREHHRPRQRHQQLHELLEALAPIDVRGAMRRHGQVGAGFELEVRQHGRALAGDLTERHRHVGHHVPDEMALPGRRLAFQVAHRGLGGAEQQLARVVGQHAVQLLRHRAVEGAHAGLHMTDRHARLSRRRARPRACCSCRRRRGRDRARARRAPAREPRGCAPSGPCSIHLLRPVRTPAVARQAPRRRSSRARRRSADRCGRSTPRSAREGGATPQRP